MSQKRQKGVRSRCYMIMQYEKNPLTGEDLNFNEKTIKESIAKKSKSLYNWAYVLHDKDVYNEDDVANNPEFAKLGEPRGRHWHVMLKFNSQAELSSVAKAFGVPENFVEKWSGMGAFEDGCMYLTHEHDNQQAKGKYLYSREDVVFANEETAKETWDIVDKRIERSLRHVSKGEAIDRYIRKLASGEMTYNQVLQEDEVLAIQNIGTFKTARRMYLKNAPLPLVRSNFYIHGHGGAGKGVISKALARSLYPDLSDEECYFVVGDGRVAFDGYDGQPVIIWDDWRAIDLLKKFDRGTVWKIFGIHPEKVSQNIKHGEIILANAVNIVNSVNTFKEFMEQLAGEYKQGNTVFPAEDIKQGYRRFPLFINVDPQSFDLYASMSLTGGEMAEYQRVFNMGVNINEFAKNPSLNNTMTTMKPVLQATKKVRELHGIDRNKEFETIETKASYDDNEIARQFGFFDDDVIEVDVAEVKQDEE